MGQDLSRLPVERKIKTLGKNSRHGHPRPSKTRIAVRPGHYMSLFQWTVTGGPHPYLRTVSPDLGHTGHNSNTIIRWLKDQFEVFGLPEGIIMDNGLQFRSAKFEGFLWDMDIHHYPSAVYNAQENGVVESFNRFFEARSPSLCFRRENVESGTLGAGDELYQHADGYRIHASRNMHDKVVISELYIHPSYVTSQTLLTLFFH